MNPSVYLLTEDDSAYEAELTNWVQAEGRLTHNRSEAQIVLAAPPRLAACLPDFPKLQWVQSTFAGVDALLQGAWPSTGSSDAELRPLLTNVRGLFGQQMAEYVMGLGLYHARHMPAYAASQSKAQWQPKSYESVRGQCMVIVGTGSIGQYLAKVAKVFGFEVLGVNRSGTMPESGEFDAVVPLPTKGVDHWRAFTQNILAKADWLVNTLPSTPHTRGLFDQAMFSACQNTLFFNVGRGCGVVEGDLLRALEQGHIAHAFLDVFTQEPLCETNSLWGHPRVTVTPHVAAPSVPKQVIEVFKANYRCFMANRPLNYIIDPTLGY